MAVARPQSVLFACGQNSIRSPMAALPVPALVVRSASSSDNSDQTGPGPVVSERVCTIFTGS